MVIRRCIVVGALTALFGTFLSGPLGLWVVAKTHPQPPWHDAQTFVSSFYPVQIVPYLVISMTSVAAIAVWGAKSVRATHVEKIGRIPGDELIAMPIASLTHAITIDRSPQDVWPWLAQMGADRGGWYSYDTVDNGGRRSAERTFPEFQTTAEGSCFRRCRVQPTASLSFKNTRRMSWFLGFDRPTARTS